MELVTLPDGEVAPRLNDVTLDAEQARKDHATLMESVKATYLNLMCWLMNTAR